MFPLNATRDLSASRKQLWITARGMLKCFERRAADEQSSELSHTLELPTVHIASDR